MANPSQAELLKKSINTPDDFWGDAAKLIHWDKPYKSVLNDSNKPFYKWFEDGELNTCYNALDLHVEQGRGDQVALIYDSPVTETKKTIYIFAIDRLHGKICRSVNWVGCH